MEDTGKEQDILPNLANEFYEKRLSRAVRKVRAARYVLYALVMLSVIQVVNNHSANYLTYNSLISFAGILFLLGLLALSRKKPFVAMLIAAAIFITHTVYVFLNMYWLWGADMTPSLFLDQPIFFMTFFSRILINYLIIRGAIDAWQYEQLLKEMEGVG